MSTQTLITNTVEVRPEHELAALERQVDAWPKRDIVVVLNKEAGGGRLKRTTLLEEIIKKGLKGLMVYPQSRELSSRATSYLSHRFNCVVAVGGDGGFDLAYDAVCKGNKDCAVGVIQIGRCNAMHRELDITPQFRSLEQKVRKSCKIIRAGRSIPTSAILMMPEDRYTLCGGLGMDAEILSKANARGGKNVFSYLVPTLHAIRANEPTGASFTLHEGEDLVTGEKFETKVLSGDDRYDTHKNKVVVYTKIKQAGPFKAFTEAKIDDEYLYLYFANIDTSLWSLFSVALPAINGRKKIPGVHRFRAKSLEVRSPPSYGPMFEVFGDPLYGSEYPSAGQGRHYFTVQNGPQLVVPKRYRT